MNTNPNYVAIEEYVKLLHAQLQNDNWEPDYIVGIGRGGLLPAMLLSYKLNIDMVSLDVSLRDSNHGPTSNVWLAEDGANGANILVVDDINDSGATLQWIKDDWNGFLSEDSPNWGNNIRTAVLFDKKTSKFNVDYRAVIINAKHDSDWIRFPWELWWE